MRETRPAGRQPLLVRRGRPRPRLRGVAERPGLPPRPALSLRWTSSSCGRRTLAAHAERHEHVGRRPRSGLGGRPRVRRCPRTSTRWPPRSPPRAGPAASSLTHDHPDHAEGVDGAARAPRRAAGRRDAPSRRRAPRRRRRVRAVHRAAPARPRARPPRARGGRRGLHGRRRAGRGQRVRRAGRRRARRRTSTACGACARSASRGCIPATARSSRTRPRTSTATSRTGWTASGGWSTRSRRARAARRRCSTPRGPTRRRRCGASRRSRCAPTSRSCATRVGCRPTSRSDRSPPRRGSRADRGGRAESAHGLLHRQPARRRARQEAHRRPPVRAPQPVGRRPAGCEGGETPSSSRTRGTTTRRGISR